MHVSLSRREILVARQFLDRPCWCPSHCQVRTDLVAQAFRIKNSQMSGPAWLDADRFDINATFPAGGTDDQLQSMLQTLLRDRFNLSFHRQPKETDAYGLLVTKTGPKATLRNDEVGDVRTQFTGSIRHLSGNVTMEYLAGLLSKLVDRPVVDQTQLKGVDGIALEWTDDNAVTPSTPAETVPLFTAIQEQLGLRLERRKTSVEMFVIDHVERPTPN